MKRITHIGFDFDNVFTIIEQEAQGFLEEFPRRIMPITLYISSLALF